MISSPRQTTTATTLTHDICLGGSDFGEERSALNVSVILPAQVHPLWGHPAENRLSLGEAWPFAPDAEERGLGERWYARPDTGAWQLAGPGYWGRGG